MHSLLTTWGRTSLSSKKMWGRPCRVCTQENGLGPTYRHDLPHHVLQLRAQCKRCKGPPCGSIHSASAPEVVHLCTCTLRAGQLPAVQAVCTCICSLGILAATNHHMCSWVGNEIAVVGSSVVVAQVVVVGVCQQPGLLPLTCLLNDCCLVRELQRTWKHGTYTS